MTYQQHMALKRLPPTEQGTRQNDLRQLSSPLIVETLALSAHSHSRGVEASTFGTVFSKEAPTLVRLFVEQ